MQTLSVCSGIGAPEASGEYQPVGFCEIDAQPASVLRRHFPGVPLHADLSDDRWWPDYDGVDCIIGGTPCQSFSVAGNRLGLDDERGNLMLAFLRLVERCRPRYAVWENVPGVLKGSVRPAFDLLVSELRRMGYFTEDCIIDAQHLGVPQHRPRIFVVASPSGIDLHEALAVRVRTSVEDILESNPPAKYDISPRAAAGVLRRRERNGGNPISPVLMDALRQTAEGRPLGEGETCLPSVRGGGAPTQTRSNNEASPSRTINWVVAPTQTGSSWRAGHNGGDRQLMVAPTITARGHGVSDGSMPRNGVPPYLITPTVTASGNGFAKCGVEARTAPPFLLTERGGDIAKSLTATAVGGHRRRSNTGDNHVVDSRRLRRFTPTEVERLMGFPDGWTALDDRGRIIKDTPRYRMLGNSMAVPVVGWIGRQIRRSS